MANENDGVMNEEYVTLVDRRDRVLGRAEKLDVHRRALLHRACSVLIFNSRGEMLLQQRHPDKYHSGGLWSNACCTHPRPDETPAEAAFRRLQEEMGIECDLTHLFGFVYRAELPGGLVEHEYDHVYAGRCDARPQPDEREVAAWRWASLDEIRAEIEASPAAFSSWFPLVLDRLKPSELPWSSD